MSTTLKDLQEIYDSEINCKLSSFWDGGVAWALGDEHNGWRKSGVADSWERAVGELMVAFRKERDEEQETP